MKTTFMSVCSLLKMMRMKLTVSQLCVDEDDGGDEDSPHLWFEMRAAEVLGQLLDMLVKFRT